MKKIITFIHGFCMALADSVPGVSGGTVAFLLGFYDRFVDSLDDLISGTKEKRIAALRYLIKLGIGWGIGFLSAVLVLANVFESHIYLISSLVLVASGGGGKMLLTGDMEYDEENDLLAAGVIPSCEVLKVGHHGRDDATSAALVAAVQPKVAVISTSSVILPESPAKRVLRVLSSAGAQIVQTQQAEIGVQVTLSGGNVTVEFLNN